MNLYSYVVAHDSGFAPNPFNGCCTLATCKPKIRSSASVADWIVGCGSKVTKQHGLLVYAMQVSEIVTFEQYFSQPRFQAKKPNFLGSRKQARGDNIYFRTEDSWGQLNSYHSNPCGTQNQRHVARDTRVNRILVGQKFKYFGMNGPDVPKYFGTRKRSLCHRGRGHTRFSSDHREDETLIGDFIDWFEASEVTGYISHPYDWSDKQ
jgi:hypothetical protein